MVTNLDFRPTVSVVINQVNDCLLTHCYAHSLVILRDQSTGEDLPESTRLMCVEFAQVTTLTQLYSTVT